MGLRTSTMTVSTPQGSIFLRTSRMSFSSGWPRSAVKQSTSAPASRRRMAMVFESSPPETQMPIFRPFMSFTVSAMVESLYGGCWNGAGV